MDVEQAYAGLRSAIEQGADVAMFTKAAVRTREDAVAFGHALSHMADYALTGATVTTQPQHETLFRLTGPARKWYLSGMSDEHLGDAVGQLAMAIGQVPGIKFAAPIPALPLQVEIVGQPATVTESVVERDADNRITTTRQTTRPV